MSDLDVRDPDVQEAIEQTRGAFLRKAALLGGGALAVSAGGIFTADALAHSKSDLDILNFALTLEYLETDFYDRARRGEFGNLNQGVQLFAEVLYSHEQAHVDALNAMIPALGGTPVSAPATKFPSLNQRKFVTTAIALEQTGVSAYGGAFPLLKSNDVKAAALSIHSVEARHAAYARLVAGTLPAHVAFYPALNKQQVLDIAKPFLA
ncbi:MAG TPA: ferritin-like domain-containing protein [Gaiellaceae bacterium]|nr:ferritin-like domain-containing protein [Gaiellaceae bacterium]